MNTRRLSVVSHDGTVIGYQSMGNGPGLVLVQGAMGTAQHYRQLAQNLADRFTVYLPDRRGRGMSPRPYQESHCITDDVEDLRSLFEHTSARYLFGLSSGAMIVLEALRQGLPVAKAAVYEPPFYLEGMATQLIQRFHTHVAQGRHADALVTASRIVKLGPQRLLAAPTWLLRLGARLALLTHGARPAGYTSLNELIPAMRYDFNVVAAMNRQLRYLSAIQQKVLLMGGDRSPDYLKNALAMLQVVLPDNQRIELAGTDHSAPWNEDLSGKPTWVGQSLKAFFE